MIPIAPPSPLETPRAAAPAASKRPAPAGEAEAGAAATAAAPTAAADPALRMDPELGLVVLEFRDAQGKVAASIPTSRELDAYRQAVRAGAPLPAP